MRGCGRNGDGSGGCGDAVVREIVEYVGSAGIGGIEPGVDVVA